LVSLVARGFSCSVKGTPWPPFDEPRLGVAVSTQTEAELARKGDLAGQSLTGSSVSGTDAGIDQPRPRVRLTSSEDSWPRPRGDRPSRLLGPDSRRRPRRRWPGVAMMSSFRVEIFGPRCRPRLGRTSPKVLSTPRVLLLPLPVKIRACRIRLSCSVCFLRPPRPKHTLAVL
jgi:hypothetical protein